MSTRRGIPMLLVDPVDNSYWDAAPNVANDFTSDGTTNQQSVTGLTFSALANSKYEVESVLVGQCTGAAGTFFAVSFSAAGATGSFLVGGSAATNTVVSTGNLIGTATTTVHWTSATTDECVLIKSIVIIGANAGNITVDVKKSTSGTVTIKAGSMMKIRKLT